MRLFRITLCVGDLFVMPRRTRHRARKLFRFPQALAAWSTIYERGIVTTPPGTSLVTMVTMVTVESHAALRVDKNTVPLEK